MTNKEILRKAIEKAVENGFDDTPYKGACCNECWLPQLIFSHDFAKAFWGEKDLCASCGWEVKWEEVDEICPSCCEGLSVWDSNGPGDFYEIKAYKYHLQEMVKEENRLKYLEQFL